MNGGDIGEDSCSYSGPGDPEALVADERPARSSGDRTSHLSVDTVNFIGARGGGGVRANELHVGALSHATMPTDGGSPPLAIVSPEFPN